MSFKFMPAACGSLRHHVESKFSSMRPRHCRQRLCFQAGGSKDSLPFDPAFVLILGGVYSF
jgi:hypothetical protein